VQNIGSDIININELAGGPSLMRALSAVGVNCLFFFGKDLQGKLCSSL